MALTKTTTHFYDDAFLAELAAENGIDLCCVAWPKLQLQPTTGEVDRLLAHMRSLASAVTHDDCAVASTA
jgi:hypothetical protein